MSYATELNAGIKSWAEEDRPREKMLLKGRMALSDAELIAILLGSGTRELTAVELARQVLGLSGNNLVELGRIPLEHLMQLKGIGEAKAISLAAALELGRRRQQAEFSRRTMLNGSQKVYDFLKPLLADLMHEEFWVVLLNRRQELIRCKSVSTGGITGTLVDMKMVFGIAVSEKACGIILAHNHPSGGLKPSDADIKLTRKAVEAGKVLDIEVVDHIIVTDRGYYSFSDEGVI